MYKYDPIIQFFLKKNNEVAAYTYILEREQTDSIGPLLGNKYFESDETLAQTGELVRTRQIRNKSLRSSVGFKVGFEVEYFSNRRKVLVALVAI